MPAMRPAVKQVFVLILLGAWWPGAAGAFSAEGHRVVGMIAETHLCDGARTWLEGLLDGSDLASAGVWADAVRDDPAWTHTRRWHYIDVGDRESLGAAQARSADNVLAAIERFERMLADERLPLRERATALRFFVHFVADVHQPLHVGRAGDRGGNEVAVRWGKQRTNLHAFWDAHELLKTMGLPTRDLAQALGALAYGQTSTWQASTPLGWAEESRAYRPLVYALPAMRDGVRLTPAAVAAARNVVGLRLAQAGVRLAGRLNRVACPADVPSR